MSQSTVGTESKAFSSGVFLKAMDANQAENRTDLDFKSRPFTNGSAGLMDSQHTSRADFPFSSPFGSRANAWGSSSIWSGKNVNGLSTNAVARDQSCPREPSQPLHVTDSDGIEGKTGSASLVNSSVSDETVFPSSSWTTTRNTPTNPGRTLSQVQYSDNTQPQLRSLSNAGVPQALVSSAQTLSPFGPSSRPPTINLNSNPSFHSQPSLAPPFSSTLPNRGGEQQPPFNVYTKFDRPSDPSQRKPDSAVGSWIDSSTTPSPSDERRPQLSTPSARYNKSMPASRESSMPPMRHTDELPVFTRPDYSRPSQHVTPASSRAPSISSRNGAYGPFLHPAADVVVSQFGKLGLSGDSRPSTSYKSVGGHSSHPSVVSATSSITRPSLHTPVSERARSEYFDDKDRLDLGHRRSDSYASSTASNQYQAFHPPPAMSERFSQLGNNHEFRPGQNLSNASFPSRSFDASATRSPSTFHGFPSPRRPRTSAEQQTYIDPRMQHLMAAAQLRNPYAAMYHPYAIPGALHVGAASSYMGMVPFGMPSMDNPVGAPREASAGDNVQSALLFEFKSNPKSKRYELRDIHDHIAEFSGDQYGSRFIQTKLETANSDEKERVFREIEPNALPLMTDVFGNYVIQKFFEHGDQRHKKILANKMRGEVLHLSLQMYGCRVVQKALDHVLVDQQASLVSELENHVLKCVKDQNGNHVIQKAIERCPSSSISFIIAAFQGQVQHLSVHPYGCRVIQRCLEKCDLPSKALILSELVDGIPSMISDQFGNYVVQHIVSHEGEAKQRVLAVVSSRLEAYSKHKFASNVVEACLERANDAWRREVVLTLAHSTQRRPEGEGVMVSLIKDNFGNYVIQKILDTLNVDDYRLFLDLLRPAMNIAKRSGCGKQVLSIEKKMHRFPFHHPIPSNTLYAPPAGQVPLPTTPFASHYNSAATTPPPALTADTQSLQSSGLSSVNGDTIEGAPVSRKGSGVSPSNGLHS